MHHTCAITQPTIVSRLQIVNRSHVVDEVSFSICVITLSPQRRSGVDATMEDEKFRTNANMWSNFNFHRKFKTTAQSPILRAYIQIVYIGRCMLRAASVVCLPSGCMSMHMWMEALCNRIRLCRCVLFEQFAKARILVARAGVAHAAYVLFLPPHSATMVGPM